MGAKSIHDSLKAAVACGVKVRVLTSECGMGMPPAESFIRLKALTEAGVIVQVMPFPATTAIPYVHAKTMTIDRETVFLGSENFSNNSIQKARELGIIFKDKAIENKMNSLFESDWAASIALPAAAPVQCSPLTVAI